MHLKGNDNVVSALIRRVVQLKMFCGNTLQWPGSHTREGETERERERQADRLTGRQIDRR